MDAFPVVQAGNFDLWLFLVSFLADVVAFVLLLTHARLIVTNKGFFMPIRRLGWLFNRFHSLTFSIHASFEPLSILNGQSLFPLARDHRNTGLGYCHTTRD